MAKVGFIILRVLIGIGAVISMAVTTLIILVIGFFNLMKGLLGVFGAVVVTFATAFQKSPTPADPDPNIPKPLIALLIFFFLMFASVFLPSQKIFLHIVAVMGVVAAAWEIWRVVHEPQTQAAYWPLIALWMVYYVICLRRA